MATFVRASKFRHVFCDPARPDATFTNLRLSTITGDQNYIKANPLYFAVGIQGGGGPFTVVPLNKPGRVESDIPQVTGHTAPVLDFEWNPFHDGILASCSEDQTIKIWGIPDGGLTATINEPLADLHGHARKVTLLRFNPTASNVLASTSGDNTVKIWDIEKGSEMNCNADAHKDLIQEIVWDYTGASYATSSKDKAVRIFDGRTGTVSTTIEPCHEGGKSVKMTYLGNSNKLATVGFTKQSQRQLKIWDSRNLRESIKNVDIDQAAGVIMPFFDPDTSLLFLAGKGDGNVRFYEIANESPFCYPITEVRSNVSAKGMAWIPKRGLNIMGCETARMLKLTSNSVEPMSFCVPRKSEAFQNDIYPDTAAPFPAHSADEWLAGSEKAPVLFSLDPKDAKKAPASAVARAPLKSNAQLQTELDAANARIAVLESRLTEAGLSVE